MPRSEQRTRIALLCAWAIGSWIGFLFFHEPWRDEAQAWLVARHSPTLGELFFRASAEATGPFYYLLLWPFAQVFPEHFIPICFLVSWVGSLLAVSVILLSGLFPLRIAALVAFGYLFGFEHAVVARLYGWGSFFLLLGIWADKRERNLLASSALALAASIQLTFSFGVVAWCAYRFFQDRKWKTAILPAAATLGLLAFLQISRDLFPWGTWRFFSGKVNFFSTALAPFLALPGGGGWAGLLVAPWGLSLLRPRALGAFVLGFAPFVVLFTCRYAGFASSRHATALFLVWVVLCIESKGLLSAWRRRSLNALLGLGVLSMAIAAGDDVLRPYSTSWEASQIARALSNREGKKIGLYSNVAIFPQGMSALLDVPYYLGDLRKECPDGPGSCFSKERQPRPRECPADTVCFFLAQRGDVPPSLFPGGRWELVYEPRRSMKQEDIYLYRYSETRR